MIGLPRFLSEFQAPSIIPNFVSSRRKTIIMIKIIDWTMLKHRVSSSIIFELLDDTRWIRSSYVYDLRNEMKKMRDKFVSNQWPRKEKVLISNRFKLYRELIAQNEINAVIRNKEKVRQATTTSYPCLELLKFNHRNAKSFVFFVTHPKTQCPSPLPQSSSFSKNRLFPSPSHTYYFTRIDPAV